MPEDYLSWPEIPTSKVKAVNHSDYANWEPLSVTFDSYYDVSGVGPTPLPTQPTQGMTNHTNKCTLCKKNAGHFYHDTFKDGVHHYRKFCVICYKNADDHGKLIWFCIECDAFYIASVAWVSHTLNDPEFYNGHNATIPCPEHSLSDKMPIVKCVVCKKKWKAWKCTTSNRGVVLCPVCSETAQTCSADYCSTLLHKKMPGVVISGSNVYCEDCSLAKTSPPGAPTNYHPYSWDYRPGCSCPVCKYLSGRGPKWPPSPTLEPNAICEGCLCDFNTSLSDHNLDEDCALCHICEKDQTVQCHICKKNRPTTAFKPVHGDFGHHQVCSTCVKAGGNHWYCDVGCNSWIPNEMSDCACGGVFSYKYSPDPEFHFGAAEPETINGTPFMGFELEVEALTKGTSRRQGTDLVRSIMKPHVYCVHDGTLFGSGHNQWGPEAGGDKAFEIVSHPFTYQWFTENWGMIESLLTGLSSAGYRSWESGRCGMHIHISRGSMSEAHQMSFLNFIYGSVNLALCVGQRGYRSPYLSQFSPFDIEERSEFILKIKKNINPRTKSHYAAVNANKPTTLEARWFRGSLNPISFRKNIEFIHSLWYFTRLFHQRTANEYNYVKWLLETPDVTAKYPTIAKFVETNYIANRR